MADFPHDVEQYVNGNGTHAAPEHPLHLALTNGEGWEDLGALQQLYAIRTYLTDPSDWFKPWILKVIARYRSSPPGIWGQLRLRYKSIGGNPYDLQQAVDQVLLLQEQQTAQEPGPPPRLAEAIVSYAELQTLQVPKREVYLDWLSERSLVMIYGPRGVGKTMAMLGLAVSLTTGQPFLKWPVQCPPGVLYVEGEMPVDELRDRAKLMAGGTEPTCLAFLPSELVHSRLECDLTLSAAAVRHDIEDYLASRPALRVLILDNISCLFPGISEDSKQEWEPINAWLIRLRHRGMTVILGHHAGKGGHQRGTSGREDALNTTIALRLPPSYRPEEGCHFLLNFEKSRGIKGDTIAGLDVRFDETTGWTYSTLETTRTEHVMLMLADGVPPRLIAEELGLTPSYVYRLKRQAGL